MGDRTPAEIVVSGLGAVSPLGGDCGALWSALQAGRDGIRAIERFDTTEFESHLAGTVPEDTPLAEAPDPCTAFALTAAMEAWRDAGLDAAPPAPKRVAVVLGTSLGWHAAGLHQFAAHLGDLVDARGPRITLSSACTSSTHALGLARDLILDGTADVVLAGGTDLLGPELFAGFHALGVMSPAPCAPFSTPVGMTLGEGAGIAVIEPTARAENRGARPWARLLGYGLSGDAYHATSPEPTGAGVARALCAALADAGRAADVVDYVNVHGTGTAANDRAEWQALCRVFPGLPARPLISASKSFLGHAQGAAGILEVIAMLLCQRAGSVPPTRHFTGPRRGGPTDPVADDVPRQHPSALSVSTNSAFGGSNAAVVFASATPLPEPTTPGRRRPVRIAGLGAVGPHGTSLDQLTTFRRSDAALQKVPGFRLERIARGVDPRGMDPLTRYLIAATALGLQDAGLRLRGPLRDRAGIVVGTPRLSPTSAHAFAESIERRGLPRLSARAFSRMVLNAPTGACSRALSLRGPASTLTVGRGSGLLAVILAARTLARRDDADLMVAAGLDECLLPEQLALLATLGKGADGEPLSARDPATTGDAEGAACLVLTADDEPGIFLSGWGLAGPHQPDLALRRAWELAGAPRDDATPVYGVVTTNPPPHIRTPDLGYAPAATSTFAAIQATLDLRRGGPLRALVVSEEGQAVTAAVVLERRESP